MKLLVTGGAGYIGSVMVRQLLDSDHSVVVLDDLSSGKQNAIDTRAVFVKGTLSSPEELKSCFSEHSFDAVIHFAGVISMAESMKNPGKYFKGNTFATVNLLEAMTNSNVKTLIFSSTAGVYGNPTIIPIPETHPKNPTNPYGESKLMIERLLAWYDSVYGLKSVCMRYFNACGASSDGKLGENHAEETHLIPLAIQAALTGIPFTLFGTDYDTPDGTCVRDYIHVEDLCAAHILTLEQLMSTRMSGVFNVGTGRGISNKEVVQKIEQVSGKKIVIKETSRRSGDADKLIADPTKLMTQTSWKPNYSDLDHIISTALHYHSKNKDSA